MNIYKMLAFSKKTSYNKGYEWKLVGIVMY